MPRSDFYQTTEYIYIYISIFEYLPAAHTPLSKDPCERLFHNVMRHRTMTP